MIWCGFQAFFTAASVAACWSKPTAFGLFSAVFSGLAFLVALVRYSKTKT